MRRYRQHPDWMILLARSICAVAAEQGIGMQSRPLKDMIEFMLSRRQKTGGFIGLHLEDDGQLLLVLNSGINGDRYVCGYTMSEADKVGLCLAGANASIPIAQEIGDYIVWWLWYGPGKVEADECAALR